MSEDIAVIASRKPVGIWVAYAAALWAAVFAVFHIIWAAGWYPLLDAEGAALRSRRRGNGRSMWW